MTPDRAAGVARIRALVVDDEPMARERLVRRLALEPDFEVVGEAEDAAQAVAQFERLLPELVFLDIQMPGGSGFDALAAMARRSLPMVVFVTAYDEYALRAFDCLALDYLLKPFDDARLACALDRVRVQHAGRAARAPLPAGLAQLVEAGPPGAAAPADAAASSARIERLVVRDRDRWFVLPVEEVDWFRAARNYVEIHSGGRMLLDRRTLAELERGLDPERFVRVHRSVIVQWNRVREVRAGGAGHEVVLASGRVLPLARTCLPAVLGRET